MKKYSKFILIFFASLLFEIFIFNYNFFTTLFNKETIYVNKGSDSIFEIENIDQKVKNVKIDFKSEEYLSVKIYVRDEGNNNYYLLNNKEVNPKNKRSIYQNIHAAGKVKSIKFVLGNATLHIDDVVINSKIPLMFSSVRFLIILSILLLVYAFNSKSKIYKVKLLDEKANIIVIVGAIVLLCFVLGALCLSNDYFENPVLVNQRQYYNLTDAFRNGKTYIEEVKDDYLLNMDNPYDTVERNKMWAQEGAKFMWDYAYYKGKYYVYFGVGPLLLTYLPYNILTGGYISNYFVDFLFMVLTTFSITYLLYNICKKWFKDVKLLTFLMCLFLLISSSGAFWVAKRPDFYNVPIITSLFFTTLGLGLFISASMSKKLFKTKLVIASCSMAFVALCRPQFLISTFLIIPLYYDYFFKKFDKNKLKELLCILIPYIIFAIITCAYNYVRFGSIFDFGAQYNLTTNDMTKRGFILARIPLGIFYYLLLPTRFVPYFPYIDSIPVLSNNYFGKTIYENTYGGLFFTHLITISCLFITKLKKFFNDKKLYYFSLLSIIFAFVVMIFDTEMSGILPRYLMDFSYLLLIPTVIIVFSLEKVIFKNEAAKKILIVLVFLPIIYEFLLLLVDYAPSVKESLPNMYHYLYYLFNNIV